MTHRARQLRCVVLFLAAVALPGCSPDAAPGGAVDVATVRLSSPVVTLGSQLEGELLFSKIDRVEPTPSGGLLVVEPSVPRVMLFDSTGAVVDSLADRGEGPGEFLTPVEAGFMSDTLWVIDFTTNRVSFFHGGEFVDSEPIGRYSDVHPERQSWVPAILEGRRRLVHTSVSPAVDPVHVTSEPGLLLVDGPGGLDSILEVNVDYVGGGLTLRENGRVVSVMVFSQPFAEADKVTVTPDGAEVVVASTAEDGYSVVTLRPAGDTVQHIRRTTELIPIPPVIADSIVAARVQGPYTESVVREGLYLPDRYPPVSRVVAAADGSIWVARERVFGAPTAWDIHRPDGSILRVETPQGFDVRVPLVNAVWGLEHDEFDVPYLTLRRFVVD